MSQARALLFAVVAIGGCSVLLLSSSHLQLLTRNWTAPVVQVATWTTSGVINHTPHPSTPRFTSQQSLNITIKPPHRSTVFFGCLEGVVTVQTGGRFGNAFMEYASALGVARVFNLALVLPEGIARSMEEAFEGVEGLTLAEFLQGRNGSDGAPCAPRLPEKVVFQKELRWNSSRHEPVMDGDGPIVIRKWIVQEKYIVPLIPHLRATLRFRPNLRNHAQKLLRSIGEEVVAKAAGTRLEEVTFIGVHVRRTDYHRWLQVRLNVTKSVNESYYARALVWLHAALEGRTSSVSTEASAQTETARTDGAAPDATKSRPVAVAVTSDDMKWVKKRLLPTLKATVDKEKMNMTRIFALGTTGQQAALKDLALLSACNHSVISYGTYGLTAALLAGGHTVVYDVQRPYYATAVFAKLMPEWTILA